MIKTINQGLFSPIPSLLHIDPLSFRTQNISNCAIGNEIACIFVRIMWVYMRAYIYWWGQCMVGYYEEAWDGENPLKFNFITKHFSLVVWHYIVSRMWIIKNYLLIFKYLFAVKFWIFLKYYFIFLPLKMVFPKKKYSLYFHSAAHIAAYIETKKEFIDFLTIMLHYISKNNFCRKLWFSLHHNNYQLSQ